jgi:phosphogluconate dehydratase
VTPEAAAGGALAKLHDGDWVTLDCETGALTADVHDDLEAREVAGRAPDPAEWVGTGRELFATLRAAVGPADQGASIFPGVIA